MCGVLTCALICVQNAMVLGRIYDQMGLVASSMAFSWSRWNSEVSEDTIIMQGTEALCDEPLLEVCPSSMLHFMCHLLGMCPGWSIRTDTVSYSDWLPLNSAA